MDESFLKGGTAERWQTDPPPEAKPEPAPVPVKSRYRFTRNGARYGITLDEMKARRLATKNERRAKNGLPPIGPMSDEGVRDIFLDIEGLGLVAGSAVIELGAVVFDRETGETEATFHRLIAPDPRFPVDLGTLEWHAKEGTFPRDPELEAGAGKLEDVLRDFKEWLELLPGGAPEYWWSWGTTYDFPLLEAAFSVLGVATRPDRVMPWYYWQVCDARTVWSLAFPGERHAPRPHDALEDCLAGIRDLVEALRALRK